MSLPSVILEQLKSNSRVDSSSPGQLKSLQQEYRAAIGLGSQLTLSAEVFNEVVAKRRVDANGFFKGEPDKKGKMVLSSDEQYYQGKLINDDNDNTKLIKAALNESLKEPSEDFKNAHSDYNASIAAFQQLIEQVPSRYKTADIIGVMTELKDTARKAIQDQQSLEKQQLTDKLESPELTDALNNIFPNADEKYLVEASKTTLIADLEKSHKEQLAHFDKSTQDTLTQMHSASAKEFDRIIYLAHLHKNNEAMRKEIEKFRPEPEDLEIEFGMNEDLAYLSGIKLSDIPNIQSITGRTIQRTTGTDSKGKETVTYTVDMPRNIFGIAYYLDPRQNPKADMVAIADGIKASGYSKIKMSVDFSDPELANKRGREAFEACIKAGFDVNNITIKLNGKDIKGQEIQEKLFNKDGEKYSILVKESNKIRSDYEQLKATAKSELNTKTTKGMAALKSELETLKPQEPEQGADEQDNLVNPAAP